MASFSKRSSSGCRHNVETALRSSSHIRPQLRPSALATVVLTLVALTLVQPHNFIGLRGYSRRSEARHSALVARRAEDASALEKWKAGPVDIYSGQAQKAMYLMQENPVLFESAVEEELEALQEQKEEEERQQSALDVDAKEDTLVLRRRMSEVREKERTRVVMELLYLKVCSKFKSLKVPLIPTLKEGGDVRFGSLGLNALLSNEIYSQDALALVREHLFKIVGQAGGMNVMGGMMVVQISLLQVGQVYAMSSLFGYYLRRVDARFQLEKLAGSFGAWGDDSPSEEPDPFDESAATSLKEYIQKFGPAEMQQMTQVASVEATKAMESQVYALFGDLRALKEKFFDILGPIASEEEASKKVEAAIASGELESVRITSEDLRRLVLEAVAFGALLNDAEKQVDSLYELTPSLSRSNSLMSDDDEGRMLPE